MSGRPEIDLLDISMELVLAAREIDRTALVLDALDADALDASTYAQRWQASEDNARAWLRWETARRAVAGVTDPGESDYPPEHRRGTPDDPCPHCVADDNPGF